jgi:type III secretion system HrpB2-like protein
MTTAIEPISAVEGALAAARPEAVRAVNEQAATRFASLMETNGSPQRPLPVQAADEPNAIGKMLSTQEDRVRLMFEDSHRLGHEAKSHDVVDVIIEGERIARQFSVATMSLNITSALAQGSNKGLQTLLKNQ